MITNVARIQKYELDDYKFEMITHELETGGFNIVVKNTDAQEVLVVKKINGLTNLIDFFEIERRNVISNWVKEQ